MLHLLLFMNSFISLTLLVESYLNQLYCIPMLKTIQIQYNNKSFYDSDKKSFLSSLTKS